MGSIIRLPGIMATATIGGAALIMAAPAAQAQPVAAAPGRVSVPCSVPALDAAISFASTHGGGTLQLAANCTYLITTPATVTDGLPLISAPITLAGAPRTVLSRDPGAAAFRILDVAAAGTLQLSNVTVRNGDSPALGGAILNAGAVTLTQDTFTGNTVGNGGGLANNAGATATVSGSTFTGNTTTSVGGGAILNSGRLTVTGSTFTGNAAPINGGALNTQASGNSQLISSILRDNTSGGLGGAMSNLGTTTLIGTVVRQNQGSAGGGIATGNANVTLRNSTVAGNKPDNCSPANTIAGCSN